MRRLALVVPFIFLAACGSSTDSSGSSSASSGLAASGSNGSGASSTGESSASSGASSTGQSSASTGASGGTTGAAPQVIASQPGHDATGVFSGDQPSVTFDQAMDASTLTSTSFTVMQGATPVAGQVSYQNASRTATFSPSSPLGLSLPYTATVTPLATGATGLHLATAFTWNFTTRAASNATLPVNLGTAGHYVILAETAISTVPASAIIGDVAMSPAAATYLTGFSLIADATNTFGTSTQVTGKLYAADDAVPTPTDLTTAISDMGTAFTDASGRAADVTELGAGDIGGLTLSPGVYSWGTGLLIPTDLHLVGSATDVWILDVAQDLTVSNGTQISLSGGALAKNVFWQVSGQARLGTTSHLEGTILSQTAITLGTGASVNGRLLAQSAVSIDTSTVVEPVP